ncbi:TM0996/MTH895 family glutaredoxin-like protein [Sedimentibacter hydroxybenzoicus DSM 7310]|uniref:TM0996/MTH895 family glutaredoxin-like protein n=1 Tax=Sedimentibacter hydroxybenzoicus DSM 7310 TaxID=1123245 RepID=A0A974BHP9_SEDHY|nr:thioredoxin family protein [Sedimentibacter hydroxybenzoicus]NYB73126.1 TM0996/MTH895 family glutaredoxin-like protein [Sedimentibacter hydroxybenzoicus DSM 7310]
MALFGFGKKKNAEEELVQCDCGGMCNPFEIAAKKAAEEAKSSGCCCGGDCNTETIAEAEKAKVSGSSVKVLGSGCAKCNQLEAATLEALKELGMDATIDHVTDFTQIAAYGVMTTPALVVDGKVVSFGKVLKKDEVVKILQKVRG